MFRSLLTFMVQDSATPEYEILIYASLDAETLHGRSRRIFVGALFHVKTMYFL